MELYENGFQRFHASEDVWPVTSCKFLLGSVHANGIEKYRALEYSPLILKLQVTFTKRLSFKTTFKGHSIIKYLNHASTKDVINTQNQSQIWIYLKTFNLLCTAAHCSLRSRKPKLYRDIKSRYPKITAAIEKIIIFLSRHIS